MEYLINFLIYLFNIDDGLQSVAKETELATKLDISLFVGNLIVSLLGTIIVGLFVYLVVTRNRIKRQDTQKELERLSLLNDLEQQIRQIHSEKSVIYPDLDNDFSDNGYFEFRSAFDDKSWNPELWESEEYDKTIFQNGRRMWLLRSDKARAGSDVLHETLLWFRNVKRAYLSDVINQKDLHILWRQILPFLIDNRYTYFEEYFNKEDVEPMRYLGAETVNYCHNQSYREPLEYITPRIDTRFHNYLEVSLTEYT